MTKNLIGLTEIDHSILHAIYDTSKKNKYGPNTTTSTSKAADTWSLACNWEYPNINSPLLNFDLTSLVLYRIDGTEKH